MNNYEIVCFVEVGTNRRKYAWLHKKGSKPISKRQARYLDEKVAYMNEVAKYE